MGVHCSHFPSRYDCVLPLTNECMTDTSYIQVWTAARLGSTSLSVALYPFQGLSATLRDSHQMESNTVSFLALYWGFYILTLFPKETSSFPSQRSECSTAIPIIDMGSMHWRHEFYGRVNRKLRELRNLESLTDEVVCAACGVIIGMEKRWMFWGPENPYWPGSYYRVSKCIRQLVSYLVSFPMLSRGCWRAI